jgi:hypothetical protein
LRILLPQVHDTKQSKPARRKEIIVIKELMTSHAHRPRLLARTRMTRLACSALLALTILIPHTSQATLIFKSGVIEEVQLEGSTRDEGRAKIVWIKMSGSWGTNIQCPNDWAWFKSDTDPHLLAATLVARTTGSIAKVYVDDGLEKLSGYCRMTLMTI